MKNPAAPEPPSGLEPLTPSFRATWPCRSADYSRPPRRRSGRIVAAAGVPPATEFSEATAKSRPVRRLQSRVLDPRTESDWRDPAAIRPDSCSPDVPAARRGCVLRTGFWQQKPRLSGAFSRALCRTRTGDPFLTMAVPAKEPDSVSAEETCRDAETVTRQRRQRRAEISTCVTHSVPRRLHEPARRRRRVRTTTNPRRLCGVQLRGFRRSGPLSSGGRLSPQRPVTTGPQLCGPSHGAMEACHEIGFRPEQERWRVR